MDRTTNQWKKLYETYKNRYYKAQAKQPGMKKLYNLGEFKSFYTELEYGRKKAITKGFRKVANITQDLVRKQQYQLSQAQGKTLLSALKAKGAKDVTLLKLRQGKYGNYAGRVKEFYDLIGARYTELMKTGVTSEDASYQIGQEFFGSN